MAIIPWLILSLEGADYILIFINVGFGRNTVAD